MTALIPRAVLFGNPERSAPTISPDGTQLAYTAPLGGVLNLFAGPVDGDAKPLTSDNGRGIRSYLWAPDSRHLLYLQDVGGDENWRLHRVDTSTGNDTDLTPYDGVQVRPVATSPRHPDEILVGINRRDPRWHDVYRLRVATGELTLEVENTDGIAGYVADLDLQIRAAVRADADGGHDVLVRNAVTEPWRTAVHEGYDDAVSPVGFSADGRTLYLVSSIDANASRLVALDLTSGEQTVLAEHPAYDVSNVLLDQQSGRPLAVAIRRERLDVLAVDPALEADIARLRELTAGDAWVTSRDDEDTRWVITVVEDTGPTAYHLYDRATGAIRPLFVTKPALQEYELAPMEPFSFQAADGLTVHGYLTFPLGVPRERLRTVLYVHGGPWARDIWGYEPTAQWLANRGYLCVQVNYRGSTGYGKAFLHAGDKEWGGKMHTDLIDAVDHLVDRGWADRDQVAIMGGSYGGYAALCGAAFTPDVFRCAVDIVGPSNLKTLIESCPPYWVDVARMFRLRAADPDTEPEFCWERSPLSKAGNIRIPMLIAQGANDPRVPQAESEQIVAALKEHGVPHEYMLFEDEGHGFAKPENALRFYARAEAFLAEHLGGRAEA